MKTLVTGGAGFIGSHLVDELIKQGYEVIVIDNLSNGKKENLNPKAKFYKKDVRDLKSIAPHFKGVDFVFHLAALPRVQFSIEHPIEANDNNINGTLNVLEAAKLAKVKRVIYSSSSSIYGDQPKYPYKENMPPNLMSPYALHKYVGELYCKMYSFLHELETVCLRYFNAYGPRASTEGAYALVTAVFLKQKKNGEPLTVTGNGKQSRDFTHVFDIVRANILAARSKKIGKAEVINIGGGNDQQIIKVARLFDGPIKFIPARIEPKKTLADIRLAKKLLNWEPKVKFDDGIRELLKTI
ncbi:MAG: NAD-dependent dehydratase [Candidatus Portnoybacteria bacterium CG_4_8_14_3_um_filter_44_10]|uniref:NAD-dependent dehydratase n=5 Tax=Candidatus Portnoyibacteriota TaxID=1817913 RepID=A0A2H0KQY8_9BACT|nr:MAG: hypothetical protein AUK17_01005 [Parcubacteria group bacterium CG2_30_44_18]PIQ74562.1 MAG: NAD-dependent dehydratase [Candidatus Portnoybacteria bacterium CG11_big_fil_rev_8_21_14_0_20_44_10]PIS16297.1 MAG: NAD-dependent dehydratase [Candidatus Portnoybacteria bacterium CG09_land_8_20_14_0_10_44_13]PIW75320.1 MAG: NAD-dependent dehydratase [Candidatus Portnoybacteria bacterium CG_4_8_14_3_um_filter_44_10]PIZ71570.1 MAG: NAD-dependent dehydratase [Candidatus Portnoybacteria bacterium C